MGALSHALTRLIGGARVLCVLAAGLVVLACGDGTEFTDLAPPDSTRIANSRLAVGSGDLPNPLAVLYGTDLTFDDVRRWYEQELTKRGLIDKSGGQTEFEDPEPRTVCVSIREAEPADYAVDAFLLSLSREELQTAGTFETVYALVENRGCAR